MPIFLSIAKQKKWLRLGLVILLISIVLIAAEGKGCLGWHAPYDKYEETVSGSSGIPKTPSNLTASAVAYDQINLAWTDNATTEDGFKIEYKTETGGNYSQLTTVNTNITNYSHKNLEELTTYFYRVCAYNTAGNSAYSNQTWTTTPETPPPPSRPTSPSNLIATALSSSEIELEWDDNSDNEDGFKIERKIDAGDTYSQITTVGTDVSIYNDTELTPSTTYFYRVRAYNEVGNSLDYTNEVEISTPAGDYWTPTSTIVTNAPPKRETHTAVWTGNEIIVWGGYNGLGYLNTGGKYDPITGTWTTVSTTNAPLARRYHTAVWTGSKMVIWGGQDMYDEPNDEGGIYYPITDTWTATSISGTPTARYYHTAIWTGEKIIVWGGRIAGPARTNSGGTYDPTSDEWATITTADAPSAREYHTAIWTGSEMIVWGGYYGTSELNTGGIYNPSTDTWDISKTNLINGNDAPSARRFHKAVWTGTKMIVWGGYDEDYADTGGIYDPASDTWDTTNYPNLNDGTGAPSGRYYHPMIWADNKMLVWGGYDGAHTNTGGIYYPITDTWSTISLINVPSSRSNHTMVWNNSASHMITWGGSDAQNYFNNGGVYTPTANAWAIISGSIAPSTRTNHTAVWNSSTSQMIVWGGKDVTDYFNTGGAYDPTTDYWEPLPDTTVMSRANHSVVWANSKMIVWGGYDGATWLDSGGVYNPTENTWSDTVSGAPSGREGHTAIWDDSASQIIIWGGQDGTDYFNDGKIYNFGSPDFWTDVTTTDAPSTRTNHTAVWTGGDGTNDYDKKMIVWGGWDGTSYLDTGGVYDPVSDTWTSVSTVYAPNPRAGHTAVWTGSRMLVWGGNDDSSWFNTGAAYDPENNLWTDNIIILDAPSERTNHTAIWTGSKMMVWGGYDGTSSLKTGGIYDPTGNSWLVITTTDAPSERRFHSAVWTGMKIIIWGGKNGTYLNTGGKYQQ